MSDRNKRREVERIQDYLNLLIIDFMHFVKSQSDKDPLANQKCDDKFKALNQKWKDCCHQKDCAWMKLNTSEFANRIQGEADKQKGIVPAIKRVNQQIFKIITLKN